MQKNPYIILGIEKGATKEEVEQAYKAQKAKYQALRFEDGEVGANAAKMLDKIEVAYEDCLIDIANEKSKETYGSTYGEVESLIKDKRLDEAQELLDKCETRDAEWHYQQANIYFKKQWHSEAKTQLEISCDLDPSNQKYKDTLDRLNKVMNNNSQKESTEETQNMGSRAGYANPNMAGQDMDTSTACCNALSCACCADTCCECMGGDCIPCC